MNIYKNIIIVDIILMALFIIFPVIAIINANIFFRFYDYHHITIYLYIFLKGIFGIIILLKQLVKNNKPIHGRKYLFCLLPTAIILLLCLFYWVFIIRYFISYMDADQTILDILLKLLLPSFNNILNNKGFYLIFEEIISNMLFQLILFTGLFMWSIYWTFYNNKIRKWMILLINIVTPLYFILDIVTKIFYGP